jgi:hypothetical protein
MRGRNIVVNIETVKRRLSSVAMVPAWVWICTIVLPAARAMLFGKVLLPASLLFLWVLNHRDRKGQPKGKTIHFDDIKGQAIRQRYIDMRPTTQ